MNDPIDSITFKVIGAAIEVHRHLGPGYLESVYEEALTIEMIERKILFERQYPIAIDYKGHAVGNSRLDFLIDKRLVVEIKAVEQLNSIHQAQILSYLKMTDITLGLLINFNVKSLTQGIRRIIRD